MRLTLISCSIEFVMGGGGRKNDKHVYIFKKKNNNNQGIWMQSSTTFFGFNLQYHVNSAHKMDLPHIVLHIYIHSFFFFFFPPSVSSPCSPERGELN